MRLLLFTAFFILKISTTHSQDCSVKYFDPSNIEVPADSAYYKRVVKFDPVKPEILIEKQYFRNDTLKLTGTYLNRNKKEKISLCRFDNLFAEEKLVKHGEFKEWNQNGTPYSLTKYKKGKVQGQTQYWDEQGNIYYLIFDETAQFKGQVNGFDSLRIYIAENIVYPEKAYEKKIQGTVYVQFSIDTSGYVTEVKLLKKVHPLLDKEAIRIIKSLPQWVPAKNDGKTVKSQYTIPVVFEI